MKNVKGMLVGLMLLLIGAVSGSVATRIATIPKANGVEATMELSAAISLLDDSDMAVLAPMMTNPDAVQATNDMLGGSANCQAFVSTYCTNDPAFVYRLLQYVQDNK